MTRRIIVADLPMGGCSTTTAHYAHLDAGDPLCENQRDLPGSPNRRCSVCANATVNRRLAPLEPVLCNFCVTRLDAVQMDALDEAGWTYADPSSAMSNVEQDALRSALRGAYLRLLLLEHP